MVPINQAAAELETQAVIIAEKRQTQSTGWLQAIRQWWKPQTDEWMSIGKSCQTLLDRVEHIPVTFHAQPETVRVANECHLTSLKAAKAVYAALSGSASKEEHFRLPRLMQRIAALQYRIEGENGGWDRQPTDQLLKSQLCVQAAQWKRQLPLAVQKELIPQEIRQLEQATSYPEFARLLLASKKLRESFFTWALRDGNGVAQFIEFPATCAKIKSAFVAARIGRLGPQMLRLEKRPHHTIQEKILSLPFHIRNQVEYVSILDQSKEVELAYGWRLKISEIFDIFSKKNREVGDLEFFGSTGITNWNSHQIGGWDPSSSSYNPIDLTQKEWWKQLPRLETVSRETLEKRLHEVIGAGEWILCAKATRTTPDLDLDARHGYLEVAIPVADDRYALYPFGNLAGVFPNTPFELVSFLGDTVSGKIAYPDENFFYSHRQQAFHAMKLTPQEGKKLMGVLQKELIKAKHGHVIFQLGAENCAFWSQKVMHQIKEMPNFYRLEFDGSQPLNPILKGVFSGVRMLPPRFKKYGIAAFDRLFGSHRGKKVVDDGRWEYKSHHTSAPRNEGVIYQPGFLHRQIEQGQLKGGLSFGNSGLL